MSASRLERSLPAQMERMERARMARREKFRLRDRHVTLSHGSGGKASFNLIESLFVRAFDNPLLDAQGDAAVFPGNGSGGSRLALTTDSFVVSPLFFPGGDIGRLAVHGTVNDLAMSGARPVCLSAGLILEEGLEIEILERIVSSMAEAAREAGVAIGTGDTKVVERGKADRMFVNTSGVGVVDPGVDLSPLHVRPGDRVLVSGTVGDHGMAVMLAREALELEAPIESDTAPLNGLVESLLRAAPGVRVMKDPTRGGVATSLNEIAIQAGLCISVDEERVPVQPAVRGACEILGIDPLHIANEGKMLAIVPPAEAEAALLAMQGHRLGRGAAMVGEVLPAPEGMVVLRTGIGGTRVLEMLVGDPLPRIC